MSSVVRIAKAEDHTEIARLFLQSHRENGQFTLAPEKVDWFIHRALHPELINAADTATRGVIAVIGEPGKLEALALMMIDTFWYTNDRYLSEYLVYVDPEHRKSSHARAIIAWMKHQSDLTGLPLLTGVISNERTEGKVRLYRRMLPYIGGLFLYRSKKVA